MTSLYLIVGGTREKTVLAKACSIPTCSLVDLLE